MAAGRPSYPRRPGVPAPSWQPGCWRRIPRAAFASRPSSETAEEKGGCQQGEERWFIEGMDFCLLRSYIQLPVVGYWYLIVNGKTRNYPAGKPYQLPLKSLSLDGSSGRHLRIWLVPYVPEQLHFRLKIKAVVSTYHFILWRMVLYHYISGTRCQQWYAPGRGNCNAWSK